MRSALARLIARSVAPAEPAQASAARTLSSSAASRWRRWLDDRLARDDVAIPASVQRHLARRGRSPSRSNDLDRAGALFEEVLALAQQLDDRKPLERALGELAGVAAAFAEVVLAEGDVPFAAGLEATTAALLEEIDIPLQTSEQQHFEQTKEATRERLATRPITSASAGPLDLGRPT